MLVLGSVSVLVVGYCVFCHTPWTLSSRDCRIPKPPGPRAGAFTTLGVLHWLLSSNLGISRRKMLCSSVIIEQHVYVPGSKLVVLGMAIPPLIGNPCNGYINPYYWVDDHPLLYGNNGSLDPGTHEKYSSDSVIIVNGDIVSTCTKMYTWICERERCWE